MSNLNERARKVLQDTLDAYDVLRNAHEGNDDESRRWPVLALVAVKCVRESVHDPDKAWQRTLDHYAEVQRQGSGWVRHRSMAYWIPGPASKNAAKANEDILNRALSKAPEVGSPIAGEWSWCDTAAPEIGISVHLRPDPDEAGMLVEWRYEARLLERNQPLRDGEIAALCQDIAVLAHPPPRRAPLPEKLPALVYHVYWGADGDDHYALRRLFARFVGFAEREDMILRPRWADRRRKSAERGEPFQ